MAALLRDPNRLSQHPQDKGEFDAKHHVQPRPVYREPKKVVRPTLEPEIVDFRLICGHPKSFVRLDASSEKASMSLDESKSCQVVEQRC
ncbi:hypothetical protein Taro_044232 [Colocasia esculenta]|uniref:Uncharacterized protein n=1 Tax=Colocasia esculenta TaxID=4460 RepID=A0A843WTI1_COLES|nr:hypothetical protein [Colocasia esculenta]